MHRFARRQNSGVRIQNGEFLGPIFRSFKGFIAATSPIGRDKALDALEGKKIGISGKITEYNGKPEIVINSLTQILH